MKNIDHIVYAVPNLKTSMDNIENLFGIRPVYGGRHLEQGTHNALLNLGNEIYLELLAIDPENKSILPPLWMGVNLITKPTITRWARKSKTLQADVNLLKKINPVLSKTKTGMRQKQDGSILKWELSIPDAEPLVEVLPFFIDWKDSEHPTAKIPQHCTLISFELRHPKPASLEAFFKSIDSDMIIQQADEISLTASIQTPNGVVVL